MLNTATKQFANYKQVSSLSELVTNYDGFVIDLWGVLHDGAQAYPYALEALKKLKADGKKIILLSNAPRRAFKAKTVLDKLGFTEDLYDVLLTSGELTYNYAASESLGDKYFYIGPEKDKDIFEELPKTKTETADEANFAICTGFNDFGSVFEERKPQLDAALAAKLPLLCANPDMKVVKQTGEVQICAGVMAEYYAANGGKVVYFGKPHSLAYEECFKLFGNIENSRICAIGDSLHTDVAGAINAKIDSIFISSGIHLSDLEVRKGETASPEKLEVLFENYNSVPTYIMPYFKY